MLEIIIWVIFLLVAVNSTLQIPADKQMNETRKSNSVHISPTNSAEDEKATGVTKHSKLTVSVMQ